MDKTEKKALSIAEAMTRLLRIPPKYLKASRLKVDSSVLPNENIWIELEHDGNTWLLRQRVMFLSLDEMYVNNKKPGLHLSESALGWLVAKAITTSDNSTTDIKY